MKPGSVDTLASMIEYLIDNPKIAKEYGKAGRAKVLANYTWDKVGYKLDHLIKSIS